MNKNNNIYVILYAAVMVIIVAIGLAFTSQSLKDRQKRNEDVDKMRQVLRALNIDATAKDAEARYSEVIKDAFMVDAQGAPVPGSNGTSADAPAFQTDASKLLESSTTTYPVFVAEVDGQTLYVLTLYGRGLWGPIWGYISMHVDGNEVYGTDFSHAGETPGLGAEIVRPEFRSQFVGKHVFRDGQFASIAIVKPGKSATDRDYVDGISGGTITSKGVDAMLQESLGKYQPFLSTLQK